MAECWVRASSFGGRGRPVTGSWWLRAAGCRHCFLIGGCLLVTGWWMAGCWVLNDCRLVRLWLRTCVWLLVSGASIA